MAVTLGDIARAEGMTQRARDTGLGRESVHRALSPPGKPEFATISKVVAAPGLKLHANMGGAQGSAEKPHSDAFLVIKEAPEHGGGDEVCVWFGGG